MKISEPSPPPPPAPRLSVAASPAFAPPAPAPIAAPPAAAPDEFPAEAPQAHLTQTFDGRLGIPVLEVINAKGDVAQSYPSQRQLQAYAASAASPPREGTPPPTITLSSSA